VQAPLPVQLKNITATIKSNDVSINWDVADEIGIIKYEIQKSNDGNNFSSIGSINATKSTNYNFIDPYQNGISYYRIKVLAQDGTYFYSKIVKVNYNNNRSIITYPNPVSNKLTIFGLQGKSYLRIINQLGQTLSEQKTIANSFSIDLSNYKSGVYTLSISDDLGRITTKKIIKN